MCEGDFFKFADPFRDFDPIACAVKFDGITEFPSDKVSTFYFAIKSVPGYIFGIAFKQAMLPRSYPSVISAELSMLLPSMSSTLRVTVIILGFNKRTSYVLPEEPINLRYSLILLTSCLRWRYN